MFRALTGWMFAAVLLYGVAASAEEKTNDLLVGDKAPRLEVSQFVKGEPIKQFESGKLYVVEFWATWCGPCRESIPHLTELQKKHNKVTFIGVTVESEEKEIATIKKFVEKMGEKMEYRVAIDAAGEGGQGKMGQSWMEASHQQGIPCAYIVNGEGQVAWIGHPSEMEKPLDAILSGKYDLKAEAAKFRKAIDEERAEAERQKQLAESLRSGDPRQVLAKLDELINGDATIENSLATAKLSMLMSLPDESDKTIAYAKKLIEKSFSEDFDQLINVANMLSETNPEAIGLILPKNAKYKPDAKLVKLARTAIDRAEKVGKGADEEEKAMLSAISAQVYFADGQKEPAVTAMKKAIALAKTAGMDVREFKATLRKIQSEQTPNSSEPKEQTDQPKK